MSGAPGAAFAAAALLELQDAPVDVANFFHGELGGFGLFSEQGGPRKVWQALRAFQRLVETPRRVESLGAASGKLALAAGLSGDGREATVLISNFADASGEFDLDWKGFEWTGGVTAEIRTVSGTGNDGDVRTEILPDGATSLRLPLAAPALITVRLRPTNAAAAQVTLSIDAPASRLVFQRGLDNQAGITVQGRCAWPGAAIEVRTVDLLSGKSGNWAAVGQVMPDFQYRGRVTFPAGWYRLEVRALTLPGTSDAPGTPGRVAATASVDRVGVGEVFIVAGHSVAHGGQINLPGADDDRVNTIALPEGGMEARRQYRLTGDPRFLPEVAGQHFGSGVLPAPAGNGTYFWAAFGEHVAREQQVPVLLLNAAFGGTSLEHWAKSARGESFDHPFVNSAIRMPYIRLEHALTKYAAITGLRAILSDQGQNDWPERDEGKILTNYQAWIAQARRDARAPDLAVIINRQSPPDGFGQIRRVQERMIAEYPHCYSGPDYDTMEAADTVDKVHLSESGERKAARFWADALTPAFFQTAIPLPPG
jgi:hypothetical protein